MSTRNWIDRWINNNVAVTGATLLWVAIPVWLIFAGLPQLADMLSQHIPVQWQSRLGDYAKREVRNTAYLQDSRLDEDKKRQVLGGFEKLTRQADLGHVKLELMRGMSNAFALPGNTVVITDELVLALDNEALMAVLAHELGHIKHHHVMRRIVGSTMLSSLLQLTVGQSSAGSKMGSLVGEAFIGSAYSRQAEIQADAYAVDLLRQVGISPLAFVRAMQEFKKIENKRGVTARNWTSSHPSTQDRIEKLQNSQP